MAVAGQDGFNWGYDPLHYTTPGGLLRHRPGRAGAHHGVPPRWSPALNGAGLRVVMDVVYNHTPAAGQDPKSVLDQIVPGLLPPAEPADGAVETSTCCANTAPEHAHDGQADGRLGGHLGAGVQGGRLPVRPDGPPPEGDHARRAARAGPADPAARRRRRQGSIYLYGEGWNFGEVANDARFVQATQANMAGTGIGTFNDRLRDAVRGGGPFDDEPARPGLRLRPVHRPQRRPVNGTADEQRPGCCTTRT